MKKILVTLMKNNVKDLLKKNLKNFGIEEFNKVDGLKDEALRNMIKSLGQGIFILTPDKKHYFLWIVDTTIIVASVDKDNQTLNYEEEEMSGQLKMLLKFFPIKG